MVWCGGCGEDVQEKCKDHPGETIQKQANTLYYTCQGGQGGMPHDAICMSSGGRTTDKNIMYPPGHDIPPHRLTALFAAPLHG